MDEYSGIALTPGQVALLARVAKGDVMRQLGWDTLNEQDMAHAKYIEPRAIGSWYGWHITYDGSIALKAYQGAVNESIDDE